MDQLLANTIFQFIAHVRYEKRYSPHTVKAYEDDLAQFTDFLQQSLGGIPLQSLTAPLVRSWLASLKEQELSSRSITRKISTLKSFFRFALRQGAVQRSPMTGISSPKAGKRLPSYVEEDQMDTLLRHVEFTDDWKGNTARLAITMLYECGIRLAELVGCREDQVDHANRNLKVLGKGNKERVVPVSDALLAAIRHYIGQKQVVFTDPDRVFLLITEHGSKLYPRYVYRLTREYLQQVTTIDKKSPHVLRHSFATHLMNNGAELNAVKELLGHSSLAATQVYTHNSIEKLKNIHKKAHPKG